MYYKLHTELNKRECSKKCEVIFQTCHFLTRFVEIADRKEGDKYYSNWRSLECFKIKRSKDICEQESEMLKCRWIKDSNSANFVIEIRN